MSNPRLPNLEAWIAAGLDPKTGLPLKMGGGSTLPNIQNTARRIIRIQDEQDAVRGQWYNIPPGFDQQVLERIIYYKGRGMLFHIHGQFYFLPFAKNGQLDVYGRGQEFSPLPFFGRDDDTEGRHWISQYKFRAVYNPILPEELTQEIFDNSCVILNDYTPQYSQVVLSRSDLNSDIIDLEANCLAYLNTALANSSGVEGINITSEDEAPNVYAANAALQRAALTGEKFIPITSQMPMQGLSHITAARAEEFLVAMQSLDNLRLGTHGLSNGGLFEKKAYENTAQTAMSASTMSPIMADRTWNRQNFCNIVNSIWHIGMWYEPPETGSGMDVNGDGQIFDDETRTDAVENAEAEEAETND